MIKCASQDKIEYGIAVSYLQFWIYNKMRRCIQYEIRKRNCKLNTKLFVRSFLSMTNHPKWDNTVKFSPMFFFLDWLGIGTPRSNTLPVSRIDSTVSKAITRSNDSHLPYARDKMTNIFLQTIFFVKGNFRPHVIKSLFVDIYKLTRQSMAQIPLYSKKRLCG